MGLIIGISGKIGSGKDTVADMIRDYFYSLNFQNKSFAANIKKISEVITGIPYSQQASREGKQVYLPEWGLTVGEMQQKIGVDLFREKLHNDTWVLSLFSTYQPEDFWVISDMRFSNEAEMIRRKKGILIRLEGDPLDVRQHEKRKLDHSSEIALDDYPHFDIKFENVPPISNLNKLMEQIEGIMKERNIIE